MATVRVVSCVTLSPEPSSRRVTTIGGMHPHGRRWSLSAEAAIAGIDRGEWTFHIELGAGLVPLTVGTTEAGERCLTMDCGPADCGDLVLLPGCPAAETFN